MVNFIKTKHPTRGQKGGQKEVTQVQDKSAQTQKGVTRGQRNKLCYRTPTSRNKHIKEGKGRET